MSHFYGNMQGSRGETTRCGTKHSGHACHIRGWDSGIRVYAHYNETTGKDEFSVYMTAGSNGGSVDCLIACVVDGKLIRKA